MTTNTVRPSVSKAVDVVALAGLRRHCRPDHAGVSYARAVRIAADLSLSEIGGRIGVSGVTIARWETGRTRPKGELAARYLQLLEELRTVVAGVDA